MSQDLEVRAGQCEVEARKIMSAYYLRNNPESRMHEDILRDNWLDGSGECEKQLVDAISDGLSALRAELEEARRKQVDAWNAFGPPSKRDDSGHKWKVDDLAHLPLSAGGALADQIVSLEDALAGAEAELARAREALKLAEPILERATPTGVGLYIAYEAVRAALEAAP